MLFVLLITLSYSQVAWLSDSKKWGTGSRIDAPIVVDEVNMIGDNQVSGWDTFER